MFTEYCVMWKLKCITSTNMLPNSISMLLPVVIVYIIGIGTLLCIILYYLIMYCTTFMDIIHVIICLLTYLLLLASDNSIK